MIELGPEVDTKQHGELRVCRMHWRQAKPSMFHSAVQSPIVSLFSSTGSDPLGIWSKTIEGARPSISFVHLLHDESSKPEPAAGSLISPTSSASPGYLLDQTVLHIQSPDIRKVYIECPPAAPSVTGRSAVEDLHSSRLPEPTSTDLGIRHPYIHLQVRSLEKDWSFEIGIKDQAGRNGVIRLSTFQVRTLPLLFCVSDFVTDVLNRRLHG
jgi:Protein of unknown function (DUF667)